jgi:hypothetical protein
MQSNPSALSVLRSPCSALRLLGSRARWGWVATGRTWPAVSAPSRPQRQHLRLSRSRISRTSASHRRPDLGSPGRVTAIGRVVAPRVACADAWVWRADVWDLVGGGCGEGVDLYEHLGACLAADLGGCLAGLAVGCGGVVVGGELAVLDAGRAATDLGLLVWWQSESRRAAAGRRVVVLGAHFEVLRLELSTGLGCPVSVALRASRLGSSHWVLSTLRGLRFVGPVGPTDRELQGLQIVSFR